MLERTLSRPRLNSCSQISRGSGGSAPGVDTWQRLDEVIARILARCRPPANDDRKDAV
jgi:hypothetical protein